MPIDRVEEMIRGEAGTDRSLDARIRTTPRRAEHTYTIVREIIHVPTVRAKMEDGIDYIRLSDFGTTSGDEVRKALLDGQAKGAQGYILDLRDNGGGLLDAAVAISSLFIPQGTIVSTIHRDGQRTRTRRSATRSAACSRSSCSSTSIPPALGDHLGRAAGLSSRDARSARARSAKASCRASIRFPIEGALKITTARY